MAIGYQLVPQLSDHIRGSGLVSILDERSFLERGQELKIGQLQRKQLGRNLACYVRHHVGNIANELMIAQLKLLVLPLVIVLLQHVFLHPL